MKIKCECSQEIIAQRHLEAYEPNYEFITWYCPYCGRSGTKLIKHGRRGPMVMFNRHEPVAPVADEPCRHRIPISEYGGERTAVPFVPSEVARLSARASHLWSDN
jgi:hypothetical protein